MHCNYCLMQTLVSQHKSTNTCRMQITDGVWNLTAEALSGLSCACVEKRVYWSMCDREMVSSR